MVLFGACLAAVVGLALSFDDTPRRSALQIISDDLAAWRAVGTRSRAEREALAEATRALEAAEHAHARYLTLERDDIDGRNEVATERNGHRIRACEILEAWGRAGRT